MKPNCVGTAVGNITLSSYVQGGMRGKICQAAQTNGRVKSLELLTIPDLHIGGVSVVHNSYDGREYIEELVSNINNN